METNANTMLVSDGEESGQEEGEAGIKEQAATPKKESTLRKLLTVEVILFFYVFGNSLVRPTIDALIYRKVCLSNFGLEVCDDLGNGSHKEEEDIVQTQTSHWYLAENLCYEIPSILLSFVYGSVSDNVSRKVALLLPAIGQTLSAVNYLMNSIWMSQPVYFILIGPFISGVFGGWVSCGMASFSYLSDVTSVKSRTMRIAIAEAVLALAYALGGFVSGKMLEKTSYVFVTSVGLSMYGFMALYTLVWIRDPPSSKRADNCRTWTTIFKALCDPDQIKGAVTSVFKKRENKGRKHILLCLTLLVIHSVAGWAEKAVGYLFLRRRPLLWSQTMYGYYIGFFATLATIGQLLIPVFRNRLGFRDTTCLLLAYISLFLGVVLLSFSTKTWMIYCGRMFATFGALQSVSGMIGSSIYNSIYPHTLNWWPGFCFDLAAGLMVAAMTLVVILGKDLKKCRWDTTDHVKTLETMQEDDTLKLLEHEMEPSLTIPAPANGNCPVGIENNNANGIGNGTVPECGTFIAEEEEYSEHDKLIGNADADDDEDDSDRKAIL